MIGGILPTLGDYDALEEFCPHQWSYRIEISAPRGDLIVWSGMGCFDSVTVKPDLAVTCSGTIVHEVDHVLVLRVMFRV